MPSPIRPKRLQPGAKIAFISPSARLNSRMPKLMTRATALLEGKGYHVQEFFDEDSGVQSSIANRLSEITAAFSDPSIDVVITTIGGTTFTELLPALLADTELHAKIRAHPKIVIGYSDISSLHWFLHAVAGLRTFYGPCPLPELGEANDAEDKTTPLAFCVDNLFRAITSEEPIGEVPRSKTYSPVGGPYFTDPDSSLAPSLVANPGWSWIRGGKSTGRLFGGCLTVVVRLGGVKAIAPDWRDKIVFLETAAGDDFGGPPIGRVQAAFADMIAHGVFEQAAGLVVGRPWGYDSAEQREQYMAVIRGLFCEGRLASKPFPILFGVDFGHTIPMVTLPYDALAELDSERDSFRIVESGVE